MSLFRRKPKPVPVDYVGLMCEAAKLRAEMEHLRQRLYAAYDAGDVPLMEQCRRILDLHFQRLCEIAVEVGVPVSALGETSC